MTSRQPVPYFSQWESPGLTLKVLEQGAETALRADPHWASSGAVNIDEYAAWGAHVCGMACLKMILAARTGRIVPTLALARACTEYGGYTVDAATGAIKGLIYAPFVKFMRETFSIHAQVLTNLTALELPGVFERAEFFIASVHPGIRWPDREPPTRGGHLVLALACAGGEVLFHNPSGHVPETQENVSLPLPAFERFFAGRGVAIFRGDG